MFPELKDDTAQYYQWAERIAPEEPYGVAFHLFELRRALDNLNEKINTLRNGKQDHRRTK